MKLKDAVPESGHFHAVRFYEDRQSLARMVAGFIAEGLITADPAVIIATAEHRHSILAALSAMSIDIERLTNDGHLIAVDAHETLAAFMVDGMPSATLFEDTVLPVIDKAGGGRNDGVVRAYGEMVDVLWKEGHEAAAVRLEMFWNQLANTRKFSLLCGYSMGSFYKDASFERICREHTHVVSADGVAAAINPSSVV
jgi:hypothetical protein